ncbi:tumor necrosis factor [Maylandia zebra]|uniref:Tumor necrosis factor n=2 Tax=Haplochromini TaxID=319058 RepID=A0A3P9CNU6_9CICH|nr:tumor necrosis factor [Maylandia zebra]XP_026012228.1 tumor necrosis factor-like [Astatotilapia calliptera]
MEGECMVALDTMIDKDTEKQATQEIKPRSKLTMALLAFTLCLAATAAAALVVNRRAEAPGQNEDNFDLHHTLRQISNVRAAIHLQGVHNYSRKTSVEWQKDVDQSHSQGGLELDKNEIVIPRDGLYFVYSQASFRVDCSSDADDTSSHPMVHLSHTVKRWSRSYAPKYVTILHSIRTVCQKTTSGDSDEDGNWYTAVYMGAVFNLYAHDRLRTQTEEAMLEKLEDEPGKNFFGVFAL